MTPAPMTPSQWRTMHHIIDGGGDRHLHAGSITALARRGYIDATPDGTPFATPAGMAAYAGDHRTRHATANPRPSVGR